MRNVENPWDWRGTGNPIGDTARRSNRAINPTHRQRAAIRLELVERLTVPILASVLLAAAAQLILRVGMSSVQVQQALAAPGRSIIGAILAVVTTPLVLLGLALFATSVMIWLFVLSRVEVSTAYPFSALAIVLTVLSGHFLLGESLNPAKLGGVALIVGGLVVLAFSMAGVGESP